MVAAADAQNYAQKLGISHGMVVQELGWDDDADDDLRAGVEEAIGSELLDEDTDEVVDVVLFWWRDGDGDLVDELMDVVGPLADDGIVWVLTPKTGVTGHVDPSEIAESAVAGRSELHDPGQSRFLDGHQAHPAQDALQTTLNRTSTKV